MGIGQTVAAKCSKASDTIQSAKNRFENYVIGEKSAVKTTHEVLLAEYAEIWGGTPAGVEPEAAASATPEVDEHEPVTVGGSDGEAAARKEDDEEAAARAEEEAARKEDEEAARNEETYRKAVQKQGQAALCLSGGGIRSAAFSLGVLQVLAHHRLLTQFHYLSTVSGGGYIGGWLSRWIAAEPNQDATKIEKVLGEPREILQVSNLRANSNFLTPKTGINSADTWTGILLWLRNVLLNWTVFIPALLFAVLAPNVYLALMTWFAQLAETQARIFGWKLANILLALATVSLTIAAWQTIRHLPSHRAVRDLSGTAIRWRMVTPLLLWAGLMPLVLAAGGLSGSNLHWLLGCSFGAKIAGYLIAWRGNRRTPDPDRRKRNSELYRKNFITWLILVAIATAALWLAIKVIGDLSTLAATDAGSPTPGEGKTALPPPPALMFALSILGPLSGTLTHLLLSALYVGFRHADFQDDADREWLARVSAVTVFPTLIWAVFALICLLLPYIFIHNQWLRKYFSNWGPTVEGLTKAFGAISAVISGFVAVLGGKSAAVKLDVSVAAPKSGTAKAHELAVRIATLFFIALLFMALADIERITAEGLSARVHQGLSPITCLFLLLLALCVPLYPLWYFRSRWWLALIGFVAGLFPACAILLWAIGETGSLRKEILVAHGLIAAGLFLIVSITALKIDVNRFSMHGVYRNRLVRAFLGGARAARHQDRFTSFDPADNYRVCELHAKKNGRRILYPVINVTLNLVGGNNLAWQERKASSFVITPLYCGSGALGGEVLGYAAANNPQRRRGAYIETKEYGGNEPDLTTTASADGKTGVSLGTAMTISGAAASPSMGYHSSPATAFLMTLFNVRLGAWLANPAAQIGKEEVKAGPTSALKPLLTEAFGLTDATSDNVYLSDGGHFDNLGVYEMIRRRCRYMLVVDADEDERFAFEDLARTVRFAAIDLNAKIEFACIKMKSRLEATPTSETFAIGKITYAETPNDASWLIYLKPTYYFESAPVDVRSYGTVNAKFPHDVTLNQWFGESQFESYRRLGEHLMSKLCDEHCPETKKRAGGATLADVFNAVISRASSAGGPGDCDLCRSG
jgi:Patatin-like phospholipase